MKLTIDGKDIEMLSIDQIGATLQQIGAELGRRRYVSLAADTKEIGDRTRRGAVSELPSNAQAILTETEQLISRFDEAINSKERVLDGQDYEKLYATVIHMFARLGIGEAKIAGK